MKIKNKKLFIFFAAAFLFFAKAGAVFALEVTYPNLFGVPLGNDPTLPEYVKYLFNFAMSIAGLVSVIAILFGGVYYLVSYNRGSFTNEAKEWIKAGVLGLLITMCSYLILYTINPNLTNLNLGNLLKLESKKTNEPPASQSTSINIYKEIPIGTLTETLLTRTTECYGFDQDGNPIEGQKTKTTEDKDALLPTFVDHDRADCITQLVDGAQKKGQTIATVADKINQLMNLCDCRLYGSCEKTCKDNCRDGAVTRCPGGACLPSDCKGAACANPLSNGIFKAPANCCPTVTDAETKKEYNAKDLAEKGPIKLGSYNKCDSPPTIYAGLDEFRSQYDSDYNKIKDYVEEKIKIKDDSTGEEKEITTIKTGNCGRCSNTCDQDKCTKLILLPIAYQNCINDYNKCLTDYKTCVDKQQTCRKNAPWYKLRLIDQLVYFKGKLNEMKDDVQKDVDKLNQAKAALSTCYLATSYGDLIKTYESSKKENAVIFTEKTFVDPKTNKFVDSTKYCTGFNYANSSCMKKCDDFCPASSSEAADLYKKCDDCQADDEKCMKKQADCIKEAYNKRPCIYGEDKHQEFKDCISSCQSDCSASCDTLYSPCSEENANCKDFCTNNSQCVLDKNFDDCLINPELVKECSDTAPDPGNLKYCMGISYSCENGSDQYAGYLDCANPKPKSNLAALFGGGSDCSSGAYSASFFYSNPNCLKCNSPGEPPESGSICAERKANKKATKEEKAKEPTCQELCPEVAKCPSSSSCPNCPCDQIDKKFTFTIPNKSVKDKTKTPPQDNTGKIGSTPLEEKIVAHQIVGPQCNGYSYDDDPLTFYCKDNWQEVPAADPLNKKEPLGQTKFCPEDKEIPVGQTVDNALTWAKWIMAPSAKDDDNKSHKISETLDNLFKEVEKAGKAKDVNFVKNYCKCNAKYDTTSTHEAPEKSGGPVCSTDCQYSQYRDWTTGQWVCTCGFIKCNGNPCDQVIDYLKNIWNYARQLKIDYTTLYTLMIQEQPRSDIMKELAYSRQTSNNCGLVSGFPQSETLMLSCSRVEDEKIAPIVTGTTPYNNKNYKGYCYGTALGNLSNIQTTDNWFCCEAWQGNSNEPTQSVAK